MNKLTPVKLVFDITLIVIGFWGVLVSHGKYKVIITDSNGHKHESTEQSKTKTSGLQTVQIKVTKWS